MGRELKGEEVVGNLTMIRSTGGYESRKSGHVHNPSSLASIQKKADKYICGHK